MFDLVAVAFQLVFECARHDPKLGVDVGLERIKSLMRGLGQFNAEIAQRLGQLHASSGGIGLRLCQVRLQALAGAVQPIRHGELQGIHALGQRGLKPAQALLQLALETLKRGQQFGPALAGLCHGLGEFAIHGLADRFQAGRCGLGEAAQLLPHAFQCAVIFGHRLQRGAGRGFHGIQPKQEFRGGLRFGLSQQQHNLQQDDQQNTDGDDGKEDVWHSKNRVSRTNQAQVPEWYARVAINKIANPGS